jgi:hypothetical protein
MIDHIALIEGVHGDDDNYTEIIVDEGTDDGFYFIIAQYPDSGERLYELAEVPVMSFWIPREQARNLATALNDRLEKVNR